MNFIKLVFDEGIYTEWMPDFETYLKVVNIDCTYPNNVFSDSSLELDNQDDCIVLKWLEKRELQSLLLGYENLIQDAKQNYDKGSHEQYEKLKKNLLKILGENSSNVEELVEQLVKHNSKRAIDFVVETILANQEVKLDQEAIELVKGLFTKISNKEDLFELLLKRDRFSNDHAFAAVIVENFEKENFAQGYKDGGEKAVEVIKNWVGFVTNGHSFPQEALQSLEKLVLNNKAWNFKEVRHFFGWSIIYELFRPQPEIKTIVYGLLDNNDEADEKIAAQALIKLGEFELQKDDFQIEFVEEVMGKASDYIQEFPRSLVNVFVDAYSREFSKNNVDKLIFLQNFIIDLLSSKVEIESYIAKKCEHQSLKTILEGENDANIALAIRILHVLKLSGSDIKLGEKVIEHFFKSCDDPRLIKLFFTLMKLTDEIEVFDSLYENYTFENAKVHDFAFFEKVIGEDFTYEHFKEDVKDEFIKIEQESQEDLKSKLELMADKPQIGEVINLLDSMVKLGWPLSFFLDCINNATNLDSFVKVLGLARDYSLSFEAVNRFGETFLDIITDYSEEFWFFYVRKLIADNNIYFKKDAQKFLDEYRELNSDKNNIDEIVEFTGQKLKEVREELSKFGYQVVMHGEMKPIVIDSKKLYVYLQDDEVYFETTDLLKKCTKDDLSLCQDLKKKLQEDQQLTEDEQGSILKFSGYKGEWRKENFINWRKGIEGINNDNLAEALAVICLTAHQTELKKMFYPRESQILAVLSLFHSKTGRLGQIATGEGKTLIVAMFASLCIFDKRLVDVYSSSSVLAIRDAESLTHFYNNLGISVAYNIQALGGDYKKSYNCDVVYGDAIHYGADFLQDISKNSKNGRSFDVVIFDEVDNLFIDQKGTRVRLSNPLPYFSFMKEPLVYMFLQTKFLLKSVKCDENDNLILPSFNENKFQGYKSRAEQLALAVNGSYELNYTDVTNMTSFNLTMVNGTFLSSELLNITEEDYGVADEHQVSPPEVKCEEFFRSNLLNYTADDLLGLDSLRSGRKIILPVQFDNFLKGYYPTWVNSSVHSLFLQQYKDYVLYETQSNNQNITVAAPVDYSNTGEIQESMSWVNGLHQFISAKHGIKMNTEGLMNVYISYVGLFKKYQGSIYGLTGTLGTKDHVDFLENTYGTDAVIMPNFIHKKISIFPPEALFGDEAWLNRVAEVATEKAVYEQRAVLIISQDIKTVKIIEEYIKEHFPENKQVKVYTDGKKQEAISSFLKAGNIIIASNLAGRGTDLKISKEVDSNGGLHVIMTFYPESIRVQTQGFGRAARGANFGSAQLIINADEIEGFKNFEELDKRRDLHERELLIKESNCNTRIYLFQDYLFEQFVGLTREIDSPTGYRVSLISDDKVQSTLDKVLYIYQEKGSIFLTTRQNDSTKKLSVSASGKIDELSASAAGVDVTKELSAINSKAFSHILNLTKKSASSASLSSVDLELASFLAILKGIVPVSRVYERIMEQYNYFVQRSFGGDEEQYLYSLKKGSKGLSEQEKLKSPDLLKKELEEVKLRKLFDLWQEDRKIYNKEQEIQQIKEKWAIWLKENSAILDARDICDRQTLDNNKEIASELEQRENQLIEKFLEFYKKLNKEYSSDSLFASQSYLIKKATAYMQIYNYQAKMPLSKNKFDRFSILARGADKFSYPFESDPIGTSINILNQAINIDQEYDGYAQNAIAYAKLINAWQTIRHVDQADKANQLKSDFIDHVQKAYQSIDFFLAHEKEKLLSLVRAGVVTKDSELAQQIYVKIKIYENFLKSFKKNLDLVANTNAKQMVKIGRVGSIEDYYQGIDGSDILKYMISSQNSTEAGNFSNCSSLAINSTQVNCTDINNLMLLNSSSISTNGTVTSLNIRSFNITSFTSEAYEVQDDGAMMYDLAVYQLEEDDDNWFGTIFCGILGIAQIFMGFALLSATTLGAFEFTLGFSMLSNGVGDLFNTVISIANGEPIDLEGYLKGKVMSLGISLAVAGLASFLSSTFNLGANSFKLSAEQLTNTGINKLVLLSEAIAAELAGRVVANVIQKIAVKIHDSNDGDLESHVRNNIQALFEQKNHELRQIIATDIISRSSELHKELYAEANKITRAYAKRFKSNFLQVSKNVVTGTAGVFSGLGGPGAQVLAKGIGAASDVALGMIKVSEAMDNFIEEFSVSIDRITKKRMSTEDMMFKIVKASFPAEAANIFELLRQEAFITNREIDYKDCQRIKIIDFGANERKEDAIVKACLEVQNLLEGQGGKYIMTQEQNNLSEMIFSGLKGMVKAEVLSPFSRLLSSFAAPFISELFLTDWVKSFLKSFDKQELIPVPKFTKEEVKSDETSELKTKHKGKVKNQKIKAKTEADSDSKPKEEVKPRKKPGEIEDNKTKNKMVADDFKKAIKIFESHIAGQLAATNNRPDQLEFFKKLDLGYIHLKDIGGKLGLKVTNWLAKKFPDEYFCVKDFSEKTLSKLAEMIFRADQAITRTSYGDSYTNLKGLIRSTANDISKNAPQIVQDFLLLALLSPADRAIGFVTAPIARTAKIGGVKVVSVALKSTIYGGSKVASAAVKLAAVALESGAAKAASGAVLAAAKSAKLAASAIGEALGKMASNSIKSVGLSGKFQKISLSTEASFGLSRAVKESATELIDLASDIEPSSLATNSLKKKPKAKIGDDVISEAGNHIDSAVKDAVKPAKLPKNQRPIDIQKVLETIPDSVKIATKELFELDNEIYHKFPKGDLTRADFQNHHIFSNKNDLHRKHPVFKKCDFDFESPVNKILLPKKKGGYMKRSEHSGKHDTKHIERVEQALNKISEKGLAENWDKNKYKEELINFIIEEKRGLISGEIKLRGN